MPAKSRAQQRLFGMALAVRRGNMKRSEVSEDILKIVDSDMTDKEIEDFASTKGLKESLLESVGVYTTKYANGKEIGKEIKLKTNHLDKKIFIVVKPGFLSKSKYIIEKFEKEGFKLFELRAKDLTLNEAKRLYYVHRKEDFYNNLCKYMASGISCGMTFTYEGMSDKEAFEKTDIIKDEVRKKWSESDMRNVMHSSDNKKNMEHESEIYM